MAGFPGVRHLADFRQASPPAGTRRGATAAAGRLGGGNAFHKARTAGVAGQIGLDDLDVTTDSKGNAAVKAGRYVSERVYVGVTAGAAGQSGVSVNLDITDDVKARAEATQEQSKVGVYFEKEY